MNDIKSRFDFSSNFSLEATDLSYTYGTDASTYVLDSLSYTFTSGKVYAIVGPSGAGKSTLLRVLAGILPCEAGSIQILNTGDMLSKYNVKRGEQYSYVSLLSQEDALLPWRDVAKNIRLPLELGAHPTPCSQQEAIVQEALHKFSLDSYRSFFPSELSGGLKKLTALARSYVENRPIVLLDEPFSSVDVFARGNLYQVIHSLAYDLGKLVIYVTHDFYDCQQLSDEILLMANGSLVRDVDLHSLLEMREKSQKLKRI